MDVKEVPLVIPTVGDPGLDLAVETFEAPKTIKIRGVKEILDTVEEISAEPVDLAALEADELGDVVVQLMPLLPEGVELSRDNAVLEGKIHLKGVMAETIVYGGTDILVERLPENLESAIDPGMYTVIIKADPEVLESLEKDDIQLFVDAETVAAEDGEVELKIRTRYEKAFDQVSVSPEMVKVKFLVIE
jgi:YbbR domain-containing protein